MVGDREPRRRTEGKSVFKPGPSPELSYIIGANIGDGCTLTRDWIVELGVTDYDFAETFDGCMARLFSRVNPNKILVRQEAGRLPMYVVKYASKQLYRLRRLPLKKLLGIAFAFPREFLRGFFDAEGHVDVSATKIFSLRVGAENSDRILLSKVRWSLKELMIASRIERKRRAGSVKVIRGGAFVMRRDSLSVVICSIADVRRFSGGVGF